MGARWSKQDLKALRRLYPRMENRLIASRLKRSKLSVVGVAQRLGLRKDPDFAAALSRRQASHPGMIAMRFKPGNVPENKGVKGWSAGGRSVATRFRKGHFPANRDPDFYVLGALRINTDGYIDMRVSFEQGAKGWRALHLILWEDENGPIPRGHALAFKDRERLNVCLENLELITRAENMRRNTIHNLPKPLVNTIQLLGQLKRRIREKQDRRSA